LDLPRRLNQPDPEYQLHLSGQLCLQGLSRPLDPQRPPRRPSLPDPEYQLHLSGQLCLQGLSRQLDLQHLSDLLRRLVR
jgi:hypothetical protein